MSEFNRQDLLRLLKQSQAKESFLSPTALGELSDSLNLPNNEIFGVSSFYSFLSLKPQGRYVIRICKSLPCHMQDAQMIIDGIQEVLGIAPGEISKDGRFSFELTNCIGACDLAPAMLINDDVHGHLTPEKLSKVLKEYT
jgi:NADH:ubiquinone oxidoreductase subunit E